LTICTEGRRHGLASSELGSGLLQQAQASDAGWRLRAAVVMPDHVHLIIKLEEREDLAEVVRRYKGRTSVSLRRVMAMKWQRGYFVTGYVPVRICCPYFYICFSIPIALD